MTFPKPLFPVFSLSFLINHGLLIFFLFNLFASYVLPLYAKPVMSHVEAKQVVVTKKKEQGKFYMVDILSASVWSPSEDDFVSYQYEVYFNPDEPRYFEINFPPTEEGPGQIYGFKFIDLDELYRTVKKFREWEIIVNSEKILLDKSMGVYTPVFGFFKVGENGFIHLDPKIEFHFFSQSDESHSFLIELKPLSSMNDKSKSKLITPRRAIYFDREETDSLAEVFTSQYWLERFENLTIQIEIERGLR